jgi:hypothetical protein
MWTTITRSLSMGRDLPQDLSIFHILPVNHQHFLTVDYMKITKINLTS